MSSQKPTTLREAFRQHLIVAQKKPRTVEAYMDALVQFYRFTNGKHPLHVTVNDIRAFLFHITHERGYTPRTFNQIYYGLLSNRRQSETLQLCRRLLETIAPEDAVELLDAIAQELLLSVASDTAQGCPRCACGRLQIAERISAAVLAFRLEGND
jgi:hypothetical protein